MTCTKEEIERKRLAALQKRQNKLNAQNNSPSRTSSELYPSSATSPASAGGPVKTNVNNTRISFHPYSNAAHSTLNENTVPIGKVINGTVYLISEDRFEVNPSEFCAPLINVFKTLPSKSYDANTKLWNFSINDYHELMKKVALLSPHVVLGGIPSYVLKILQYNVVDPNSIDLTPIEATLRNKLMPFQEDGVRFALSRHGRCMIADDMGLGKTFQALAVASYYRHNWPLLIVTTSSMRETWQSTVQELLPSVPLMNIATLTSGKDAQLVADRQTEIVIVSYKITSMHTDLLKNKKFGVVIIDESHYLKSHKAQCTVALSAITRLCRRAVLLSGTPALSRPAELYTQLSLIEPKLFGSYTEYGKRYCAGKQSNFGWDMTGQSNLAELQIVLQKRFLIRRTKEQVLTKLEGKTREAVILDQSLLQFSSADEQGLSQMAAACNCGRPQERHAALVTYFSESAAIKIPAICKYIRQLVSSPPVEKFLVFAHHRSVVGALCDTLDQAGLGYISIVGSTPASIRAELVEKFQHSATCRAAVLSITAASAGITLTAASLVLFAELHWNPGILRQAEDRAHRMGQARGVRVRYLLARNTADDLMWPLLQRKLAVLNDVGLSKDTFEDATLKHQDSKNNLTQYLSPLSFKNHNDYIPGTNIRKGTLKSDGADTSCSIKNGSVPKVVENGESSNSFSINETDGHNDPFCDDLVFGESFLDVDEDDELLANLDL